MISFISCSLLKEEPFCKFMLNYDVDAKLIFSFVSSEMQHTQACNV